MRLFRAALTAFFVVALSVSSWAKDMGQKSIYFVDRMTCGACLETIAKGVAGVDADAVVTGNPARGVVVVYHDTGIKADAIGESITEAGYPARVMASVNVEPGEVNPALPASGKAVGDSCCTRKERVPCGGTTESWKALYNAMKERFASDPEPIQDK